MKHRQYPIKKIIDAYYMHREKRPESKQPTAHWIAQECKVNVAIVTCILHALSQAGIIQRVLLDKTILAQAMEYVHKNLSNNTKCQIK